MKTNKQHLCLTSWVLQTQNNITFLTGAFHIIQCKYRGEHSSFVLFKEVEMGSHRKGQGWGEFPGGQVVKNPPANAGDVRDVGSIPESGRFPGGGNGTSLAGSWGHKESDRTEWQNSHTSESWQVQHLESKCSKKDMKMVRVSSSFHFWRCILKTIPCFCQQIETLFLSQIFLIWEYPFTRH